MLGGASSPGRTTYLGCVGADARADTMSSIMKEAGCDARYLVDEKEPTGTCAVCVMGGERSLVASLGAANKYKPEHLDANTDALEAASIVYSAGFFLTASGESMVKAAAHCADKGKTYCLNLSAPFLLEVPPLYAGLKGLFPHTAVLFGNEGEARCLAKAEGWETEDVAEIAARAASAWPRAGGRTVVFTQGGSPTQVAVWSGVEGEAPVRSSFDVPVVPQSEIVDTNGAGDSFVGGFLSRLLEGKDLATCCAAGHWAGGVIIRRGGCSMPEGACPYTD
jgi:adenosine kinase